MQRIGLWLNVTGKCTSSSFPTLDYRKQKPLVPLTSSGGESLQIIVMWQNSSAGPRQTKTGLPRLEGDPCCRSSHQFGSGAERCFDARYLHRVELQLRTQTCIGERPQDQGLQHWSNICSAADSRDNSHQPHHPEILSYLRGADCQSFQQWVDTEWVFQHWTAFEVNVF